MELSRPTRQRPLNEMMNGNTDNPSSHRRYFVIAFRSHGISGWRRRAVLLPPRPIIGEGFAEGSAAAREDAEPKLDMRAILASPNSTRQESLSSKFCPAAAQERPIST